MLYAGIEEVGCRAKIPAARLERQAEADAFRRWGSIGAALSGTMSCRNRSASISGRQPI